MIRTIKADNLGPLSGTVTLPYGECTVSGGSQLGKSSLMRALCLAMFGTDERGGSLPVGAITDGTDGCTVEVVSHKGTSWARTVGVATEGDDLKRVLGTTTRRKLKPGETVAEKFKTKRAWQRDALPPQLARTLKAGRRSVHAGRLVAVPFAWEAHTGNPGGGRELRDILDDIVGGGESLRDVVASLMADAGEDLEPGDVFDDLKHAEQMRRQAHGAALKAEGAAEHAQRTAEATDEGAPTDGPSPEDIERARAVLTDVTTWKEHDSETAQWKRKVDGRATDFERWDAQKAALTDEPSMADIVRAKTVLADAAAWEEHGEASTRWRLGSSRRLALIEGWDADRKVLAKEPTFSRPELMQALGDVGPAARKLSERRQDLARLEGRLEGLEKVEIDASERGKLEAKLALYEEHDGKCPECLRKANKINNEIRAHLHQQLDADPNPEESDEVLALREEATKARLAVTGAESVHAAKTARVERLQTAQRVHDKWAKDVAQLGDRPDSLEGDGPTPPDFDRPSAEDIETSKLAPTAKQRDQWERDLAQLGNRPEAIEGNGPAAPDLDRPSELDIETARQTLKAEQQAVGAKQAHEEHARKARVDADVAAGRLVSLQGLAARAAALVDAVRRAPSERLKRSIGKLGDLGPVSFELPADGDGVEVYFDGRPHRLASAGRRVCADLWLRLALRRALRMAWFPIFVDSAQDWSKGWPATLSPSGKATPVIWLQTTKGEALTVASGRPE